MWNRRKREIVWSQGHMALKQHPSKWGSSFFPHSHCTGDRNTYLVCNFIAEIPPVVKVFSSLFKRLHSHTTPPRPTIPLSTLLQLPAIPQNPSVTRCRSLLLMRCSGCLVERTLTKSSRSTHAGTLPWNPEIFNVSSTQREKIASREKTAWAMFH